MNLLYGEIIEVLNEDGLRFGRVRVRGVVRKIALGLLTDAIQGDRVLICDGVAIGKVVPPAAEETDDVFGDTRKAH
jgi:hydrogenase maturation factor